MRETKGERTDFLVLPTGVPGWRKEYPGSSLSLSWDLLYWFFRAKLMVNMTLRLPRDTPEQMPSLPLSNSLLRTNASRVPQTLAGSRSVRSSALPALPVFPPSGSDSAPHTIAASSRRPDHALFPSRPADPPLCWGRQGPVPINRFPMTMRSPITGCPATRAAMQHAHPPAISGIRS